MADIQKDCLRVRQTGIHSRPAREAYSLGSTAQSGYRPLLLWPEKNPQRKISLATIVVDEATLHVSVT